MRKVQRGHHWIQASVVDWEKGNIYIPCCGGDDKVNTYMQRSLYKDDVADVRGKQVINPEIFHVNDEKDGIDRQGTFALKPDDQCPGLNTLSVEDNPLLVSISASEVVTGKIFC